ncbi:M15 family metallopeptidase [Geodermatophilus sp. YIM 151500]|uniref:M15 family metallopeptidase n=1 Tax=Geodermatophilus sp. YIM 151500 TaxID=2984531 RepID=UPI0021E4742A|nr:M15 family metallopeptidase [Geodermatophilus sp. YIM 151500]MCV2489247.1 M15 family metallopeptidase [Geodermatophilus sp. YIM 151500]
MSGDQWIKLVAVLGAAATAVGIGEPRFPDASAAAPSQVSGSSASSFRYEIEEVSAGDLPYSYRPGCPVPPEDLRLLVLTHRTFDGQDAQGEMVVHEDWAAPVVSVFSELYDQGFPIARMQLVDDYQGSDDRSMEANNTSAFNCRSVTGRPGVWSRHSYGAAIDVNPVQNPYVSSGGTVLPPAGADHVDRTGTAPGTIHAGDPTVQAFAGIGWYWGGAWTTTKDYQHFSSDGR